MSNGLFVRLDSDYVLNPRIAAAGEAAEVAYIRILCICKQAMNDGFVTDGQLRHLALRNPKPRLARLCEVGLLEREDGGFRVVGWLERNKCSAEIKAVSASRREVGRAGGIKSGQVRRAKVPSGPKQIASVLVEHRQQTTEDIEQTTETTRQPAAARRDPNPLFETVAEVCEMDWRALTRSARSLIAKTAKEIGETGATPEDVRQRVRNYPPEWGTPTPTALAKWWGRLERPQRPPAPKLTGNALMIDMEFHPERYGNSNHLYEATALEVR